MKYGLITTPEGGRVVCEQIEGDRWMWLCDSCGNGKPGTQQEVRSACADLLQRRYSCANPRRKELFRRDR